MVISSNMFIKLALKALIMSSFIGLILAADKKPKIVSTLLNAKWSRTPFVLEAAEFLANENNEYFWAFVDYLSESDNVDLASKITDEEMYERAITFSSR